MQQQHQNRPKAPAFREESVRPVSNRPKAPAFQEESVRPVSNRPKARAFQEESVRPASSGKMSSTMSDDPVTMTCGRAVIEEFQSDRAGLAYNRPSDFLTPQWPCRKRWYLLYRAAVAVTLTSWAIGDVAYETREFYSGTIWRWFLYATNWSLLLLTLSAILQAATSAIYAWKSHWIIDPQFCRSMPIVLKCQWLLLNLAYNSAIVVTTAYWGWIAFIVDDFMFHRTTMNQVKHTANTLYVLLDMLLIATPFRLFHMFATIFLGSLYVLFNGLLFLNGQSLTPDLPHTQGGGGGEVEGRWSSSRQWSTKIEGRWGEPANGEEEAQVYNYLDWHKPVEAIITCVMAMFLCVLAQLLLFLVFRLRVWAWQRLYGGEGWRMEAELQNIVLSQSSSYNTIDENAEEQGSIGKKPLQ